MERLYRLVLDTVSDPLVLTRPGGAIVLTNAAADTLFGAPVGRHIAELEGRQGGIRVDGARLDEMMSRHAPVRDLELDDAAGNPAGVSVSIEPVRAGGGEELRLLHFRRRADESAAGFWRDEMIAMVSHELKNPLVAMRQSVDILLSGAAGGLTDGQRRFIDTSGRNIDRLTHLVDGFLDVSRIRDGAFGLERARVEMRAFTGDVVKSFGTLFNVGHVSLDCCVEDAAVEATVDAGKLEQVVVNLLSNALKHTPEGGSIRVEVDSAGIEAIDDDLRLLPWRDLGAPRLLRIRVVDTGLGMSPEDLAHAFERHHGRRTGAHSSGSHLGLSISRALVEAQGGRIDIDSRIGIGTTVTVHLPQNPATASLVTRMGLARRVLERYGRARRNAALVVVGKLAGDNWEDVASSWATAPAVNPGPAERVGTPFQLWTIDDGLAVGVVADFDPATPVASVFNERFVACDDDSYIFNGFAVGVCVTGDDARGFSAVCNVAMNRMTGARNAMSQAIDEQRDADLACVLNEWSRGSRL